MEKFKSIIICLFCICMLTSCGKTSENELLSVQPAKSVVAEVAEAEPPASEEPVELHNAAELKLMELQ